MKKTTRYINSFIFLSLLFQVAVSGNSLRALMYTQWDHYLMNE